ncbi:MAG: transposase, partial [Xenococcaceae cyanobacterium MO_188.B32]|nr:transposase [Xenococcaceae cyanobacterium MO_188.B32]
MHREQFSFLHRNFEQGYCVHTVGWVYQKRRLSRKKKGSNNRKKAGKAVAKVHRDIRRYRQDFQWKLGKKIAAMA